MCFRVCCKTFRWQCNEDEHEDEPTESSDSEDHENQRLHKSQGTKHVVKKTDFINTCIAL